MSEFATNHGHERTSEKVSRIDGAHRASAASEPAPRSASPELAAAAAGHSATHVAEQLERQTEQLGRHLRDQSRDLDRREAQLNAHLAQLDRDARAARLLHAERTQAFSERESQYFAKLRELSLREAQLAAVAVPSTDTPLHGDDDQVTQQLHDLRERQIRLEAEEHRQRLAWQRLEARRAADMQLARQLMRSLERRRLSLDDDEARHAAEAESRRIALDKQRRATEIDARETQLNVREQELDLQQANLALHDERLAQQRRELEEQTQLQQALAAQQANQRQVEFAERELVLRGRTDELDERQATLDQMQAEVTRTHREALEMRLATEQLWSQMGGKLSPEQLAESLRRLRAKLSDHFRLADEQLAAQKHELRELSARLDAQQQKLQVDRGELRGWAERRQEEIERQAAHLVAREQELDEQQAELKTEREKLARQRDDYEDEIRRLKAELRRKFAAAA
jgi:hypothetical protein